MQASLERLRQRRELGDEGGFTLIELLIVIVILGILAAIVVFAVQNLTSQSATAACGSDYKTVETAAETFKAQVGHYPQVGDNAVSGPGSTTPVTLAASDPGTTTAADDGVYALFATQTGVDGSTVGPWLKDVPSNGNLYAIALSVGTSTSTGGGVVTVYSLKSGTPTAVASCSAL